MRSMGNLQTSSQCPKVHVSKSHYTSNPLKKHTNTPARTNTSTIQLKAYKSHRRIRSQGTKLTTTSHQSSNMTNGKAITPCESALTAGPTADPNRPSSPRSLVSELRVLLGVIDSRPKPTFTQSQVAVELKSAFSRYFLIYDDDDDDEDDEDDVDEWLKESISAQSPAPFQLISR